MWEGVRAQDSRRTEAPLEEGYPSQPRCIAQVLVCSMKNMKREPRTPREAITGECSAVLYQRDRWSDDKEIPSVRDVVTLCNHAKFALEKEPTLLTIDHTSCYIVGDIHGNYEVCTSAHKRTRLFYFLDSRHNDDGYPTGSVQFHQPLWAHEAR